MELINELITPMDETKEIDISTFNLMFEKGLSHNDRILLFSLMGDGEQITLQEKKAILNSLSLEKQQKAICFLQLKDDDYNNEIIHLLNETSIASVLINLPLGYACNQNGIFLYVKSIAKKLKNKEIYLMNSPSLSSPYHFQTIKKLIRSQKNINGLYENSNDFSLIQLLKQHFPTFKIYLNESHIEQCLKMNMDGIISFTSFIFGAEFHTIIEDYQMHFKNKLIYDYLSLVHEILSFSNNSTLWKIYLKHLGYSSMEVRLPLCVDEKETANIDLLLS